MDHQNRATSDFQVDNTTVPSRLQPLPTCWLLSPVPSQLVAKFSGLT